MALALLYFEQRWWSAGVDAFRSAIQIDPKRKGDPVLVGYVITALGSDKVASKAADFLQDGAPAKPHLREAAKNHPSPRVRARAAELLRSFDRRPLFRWW